MEGKKQIIFIRVDEEIKKEFKAMAARAGKPMAEFLVELMGKYEDK